MADERQVNDVLVYRDSAGFYRERPAPVAGDAAASTADMDTTGNPVPTYKAHTYTYDDSGNLLTDTVTSGSDSWVKTYTYLPSGPASDSGWVKQ